MKSTTTVYGSIFSQPGQQQSKLKRGIVFVVQFCELPLLFEDQLIMLMIELVTALRRRSSQWQINKISVSSFA
jgi:hypothetical protein